MKKTQAVATNPSKIPIDDKWGAYGLSVKNLAEMAKIHIMGDIVKLAGAVTFQDPRDFNVYSAVEPRASMDYATQKYQIFIAGSSEGWYPYQATYIVSTMSFYMIVGTKAHNWIFSGCSKVFGVNFMIDLINASDSSKPNGALDKYTIPNVAGKQVLIKDVFQEDKSYTIDPEIVMKMLRGQVRPKHYDLAGELVYRLTSNPRWKNFNSSVLPVVRKGDILALDITFRMWIMSFYNTDNRNDEELFYRQFSIDIAVNE